MDLVSIHVPKTAGTAFANLLKTNYGAEHVFTDYDLKSNREVGPETRVVHGHFRASRLLERYPEARQITWLRHPVSWMISLYYFWKHNPPTPGVALHHKLWVRNLSLHDFIEDRRAKNIISRQFVDRDLRELLFVGVHEHFREDLQDLGPMLGWKVHEAEFDNRNPQPGYRELVQSHLDDKALVRRIERLNEGDFDLYRRALSLRARRRSPFRKFVRSTGLPTRLRQYRSMLSGATDLRRAA